VFFTSMVRRP